MNKKVEMPGLTQKLQDFYLLITTQMNMSKLKMLLRFGLIADLLILMF